MNDIIQSIVDEVKEESDVDKCREYCRKVCSRLEREEAESSWVLTTVQGHIEGEDGLAEHFYIKVSSDSNTFIIDPSIEQFTKDNWWSQKVETYIPDEEIPEGNIITSEDDVYGRYLDF